MYRNHTLTVRIAVLILACMQPAAANDGSGVFASAHHPARLIIAMQSGMPLEPATGFLADAGVSYLAPLALARRPGTTASHYTRNTLHVVVINAGISLSDARTTLLMQPGVSYVEPDYVLTTAAIPDDPLYTSQYGMTIIESGNAWDITTGNPATVAGVIDTGIDNTHPDLAVNLWSNPGEIAGNGLDDDGNGYVDDVWGWDFVNKDADPFDDNGHGTHVAGIIGATGNNGIGVSGVNWNIQLAAMKFLNAIGSGFTSDAIDAIAYANAMDMKVTNNSWGGGGFSQALKDVIDAGGAQGSLFVASAGNSGQNNDIVPAYPASYDSDNIISVASTDSSDNPSSTTNYGPVSVDLGAPGVSILSTLPGSDYGFLSGTSMAAAHVSGAAALLIGTLEGSIPDNVLGSTVKSSLLSTVESIPFFVGNTVSGGRLNLYRALLDVTGPPSGELLSAAPSSVDLIIPAGSGATQVITVTNLTNRTQVVTLSNYQEWVSLGVLSLSATTLNIPQDGTQDLTLAFETLGYAGEFRLALGWRIEENGQAGELPVRIRALAGP